MAVCEVCFRHCDIKEGALGACQARTCRDGKVVAANYGRSTALALDPVEKKPLSRFYPGSKILSYGSNFFYVKTEMREQPSVTVIDTYGNLVDQRWTVPPEDSHMTPLWHFTPLTNAYTGKTGFV